MDFPLPPVGEGLIEVELVRWLVRPGDAVVRGQGLAEVMSDKASMEVPAPFAGTITALAATEGAKVKVGQHFLSYSPASEATEKEKPAPSPRGKGEEDVGGATTFNSAQEAKQSVPPLLFREGGPGVVGLAKAERVAPPSNGHTHGPLPPAAPSVRMLARKLGVDLAHVRGSGPHGRILLDDLGPYLQPKSSNGTPPVSAPGAETPRLDFGVAGTRQKLIGLRRKIAEHMVESKRHVPHYSYMDECDFTDAVRLRSQLREPLAAAGVKLTYLAFFVKSVARALKEVPIVNSTFDETAGEVVLHDRYHIGIAVAAPNGLIVPVVKDVDKKDLPTVAADIERLSGDARNGRSKLDDLRGGTFTVTSIGNIGGLISTPIINYPEVGIMGVGKVVKRPVYDAAGALKPADIVYLSFSFDHRVVDGAVGAAFGNAVMRYLQAPALLLLPEKNGG
ncbi:MAG: 2-oxo acid dehydrogenase subunit E2 [Planctomycetes bacterium]|nr:2-oxo acid dehydrogenase subunit E2 [Planctomycetota bacterium]